MAARRPELTHRESPLDARARRLEFQHQCSRYIFEHTHTTTHTHKQTYFNTHTHTHTRTLHTHTHAHTRTRTRTHTHTAWTWGGEGGRVLLILWKQHSTSSQSALLAKRPKKNGLARDSTLKALLIPCHECGAEASRFSSVTRVSCFLNLPTSVVLAMETCHLCRVAAGAHTASSAAPLPSFFACSTSIIEVISGRAPRPDRFIRSTSINLLVRRPKNRFQTWEWKYLSGSTEKCQKKRKI